MVDLPTFVTPSILAKFGYFFSRFSMLLRVLFISVVPIRVISSVFSENSKLHPTDPTMNVASAPSTPRSSPDALAERLQMAPLPNRKPRRSVNASHDAIMRNLMAAINDVENVEVKQVVQQILRTPEKTHNFPLPPSARQFNVVGLISREEAFIRTPKVHRHRALPKFRVQLMRNFNSSPKARISRKHLPKAISRLAPSRFQNFRDLEAMHMDTKSRSKHFEQIAANACQRRVDRINELKQLLKTATTEEEKNAIYNEFYL